MEEIHGFFSKTIIKILKKTSDTYLSSGSCVKSKDVWVQNHNNCPQGYPYLTNSTSDNIGNPNCIVIKEFVDVRLLQNNILK